MFWIALENFYILGLRRVICIGEFRHFGSQEGHLYRRIWTSWVSVGSYVLENFDILGLRILENFHILGLRRIMFSIVLEPFETLGSQERHVLDCI